VDPILDATNTFAAGHQAIVNIWNGGRREPVSESFHRIEAALPRSVPPRHRASATPRPATNTRRPYERADWTTWDKLDEYGVPKEPPGRRGAGPRRCSSLSAAPASAGCPPVPDDNPSTPPRPGRELMGPDAFSGARAQRWC